MIEGTNSLVVDKVTAFAEPILAELKLELVEAQYRRENNGWVLRLFIDREGGVTLDDCRKVSREISAYLDVEDLIEHAYNLEVSSPGAERPLKKDKDFDRFAGKKVRIKVREPLDVESGQKVFTGILRGLESGKVCIEHDGSTLFIEQSNIAKARLTL